MTRRAAWTLIAACLWTVWVWLTFMWIIGHQQHPMSFKVVHGLIAAGSIAFGLVVGRIGYRSLRTPHPAAGGSKSPDREVAGSR